MTGTSVAPTPTVRFAPSPTGDIHIGNVRTALFNWLFALKRNGRFILRFDDTDHARSRRAYADGIERDLAWLGILPDEILRQSEREERYLVAADRLREQGRLYPCYEEPDELERRRRRRLAQGLPPVYDRAALSLSEAERRQLESEGRIPHWRFKLDGKRVAWDDLIRGAQVVDTASLSDPVLVRADGSYLYTLPSVVDDIEMGITHVVRGEDHVANTGAQIEIVEALGGRVPSFAHHNLLTTRTGEGLSKRLGHLSIASLRDRGLEPAAVAAVAVLIGTSEPVEAVADLAELAARFDFSNVSRSPARFDEAELDIVNARLVHTLPYTAVAGRLKGRGIGGGEAFWLAVRANCTRVDEAEMWWRIVEGDIAPVIAEPDRAFIDEARACLPQEPWDGSTWSVWIDDLKRRSGRKGKVLFKPLRLAVTGLDHGPELAELLPLIGRDRMSARLS